MTTAYRRTKPSESSYLLWVTVIVGLLLLGWWLLARSTEPPARTAAAVSSPSPTKAPEHDASPAATAAVRPIAPVETSKVFASKDPFEPLVDTGATTAAIDDTGANVSLNGSGAQERASDTKKQTSDPGDVGSGGTAITVVEVTDSSKVNVEVAGKKFRVARGETFAKSFKLLFVDGKCASMLYGDDQFHICEGERVSK